MFKQSSRNCELPVKALQSLVPGTGFSEVMDGDRDLMTRLPVRLSKDILSFLDARSLLACSRVNEVWDELTNNVPPEIWFDASMDVGVFVNRDKYTTAEEWKAFLSSMMQRRSDMMSSACFETTRVRVPMALTAIYYHNGRIAFAYRDKIELWNATEHRLYRGFQCRFETTFLKFDDNILLSGSTDGIIWLWTIRSGRFFRNYTEMTEIPTSFDFLSDYDIFVNSFFKKKIFSTGVRVRSMSDHPLDGKLIFQPQSLIVRIKVAPHPDYPSTEQQKTCFLFCLAMDYISVSMLTLQSPNVLHRIVASHKHDIPLQLRVWDDRIYKPPDGLLFDGRSLYVMAPSHTDTNNAIFEWDLVTNDAIYREDNQIISFLGVGQMYLAYEIKTAENDERIHILNKISHEILAIVNLPRRRWLTDDYLCLCETAWLDGLNGENDSGIVGAFIGEDLLSINYIKFLPRRQ